ncbi:hypothetical protein [Persicobacter sp. CCB-QB2]|uniref:hypothetical protein n=1 Tax=Persicobacter sp. CCB-QB2 TaxID=1561025 RepID=UPI0034609D40
MISSNSISSRSMGWAIVKDFASLLKARLSLLVAFSSAFGYAMAVGGQIDWVKLLMLSLGDSWYLVHQSHSTRFRKRNMIA